MPLVPTRFDDRISTLRDRLQKPGKQPGVRRNLQATKAKQFYAQQNNAPTTPTPWSAEYDSTVSKADRDLNQANAGFAGQEIALGQQYGIGDYSNPYAQARMLERNFAQQGNRTTNSYASQGQLYSGALSRARGADQFDLGQGQDALLRRFQADAAGIATNRLSAQNAHADALTAAEAQRLEDAINTPVDPSEAPKAPGFVNRYEKRLSKRAKKLDRKGRDKRADKIRQRLKDLKDA